MWRDATSLVLHPGGASIEEIVALHPEIPRRTLQRYLGRLVEAGRIRAVGRASARRYLAAEADVVEPTQGRAYTGAEWRSSDGLELARLVRHPLRPWRP